MSDVTETDTAEEILEAPEESEVRSTGQLEEEGEIAADYIEELLDIADLDGDIEIDTRGGRAYVSVTSSENANLRILAPLNASEKKLFIDMLVLLVEGNRVHVRPGAGRRKRTSAKSA